MPRKARTALTPTTANSTITKPSSKSNAKRTASDAELDSDTKLNDSGIGLSNDSIDLTKDASDASDASDSEIELTGMIIDKNCDQLRRMINNFIEAGEMKVGEFQNAIDVSANSYTRFMRQSGKEKGQGTDTFSNAWAFFKRRELKGIPVPKKRKVFASKSKDTDAKKSTAKSSKAAKAPAPPSPTIHDIHLPGEEDDDVLVFDTCNEIRRKISAYLRKSDTTEAAFRRELCTMYNTSRRPKQIQANQLAEFRAKKRPLAGNTSCVYYAAYVFFEKLRILEGKPENKHREECMEEWPEGIDTTRQSGK